MKKILMAIMLGWLCTVVWSEAGEKEKIVNTTQPAGTISESVMQEVNAAKNRSVDWLIAHQDKSGAWSNKKFPALTALAVRALAESGNNSKEVQAAIQKGVVFIVSCVQPDGGIYCNVPGYKGGGLSNYNTSICMMALHAVDKNKYMRIILNARKFVAEGQHFGDDVYSGGFGYDKSTHRAYTDLLNTYYATRAMHETADVEDSRPVAEKKVDLDWQATAKFVEQMQNKESVGTNDAGGFFYNPTSAKAGVATNKAGVVYFRSYGSITYAGLLALIYANVSKTDPRLESAFDWAAHHWSLEENPGMGKQGLYFFYNVLTKSLSVYGRDLIPHNKKYINWREEVAKKLVSLQKIDAKTGQGYWLNDTGRFWENDPVLDTAYSLLALDKL